MDLASYRSSSTTSIFDTSRSVDIFCVGDAARLIRELKSRFPNHEVLDVLGIVYPQYWLLSNAEDKFRKHLAVLKKFYGEAKHIVGGEKNKVVPAMLDAWQLDS